MRRRQQFRGGGVNPTSNGSRGVGLGRQRMRRILEAVCCRKCIASLGKVAPLVVGLGAEEYQGVGGRSRTINGQMIRRRTQKKRRKRRRTKKGWRSRLMKRQ